MGEVCGTAGVGRVQSAGYYVICTPRSYLSRHAHIWRCLTATKPKIKQNRSFVDFVCFTRDHHVKYARLYVTTSPTISLFAFLPRRAAQTTMPCNSQ